LLISALSFKRNGSSTFHWHSEIEKTNGTYERTFGENPREFQIFPSLMGNSGAPTPLQYSDPTFTDELLTGVLAVAISEALKIPTR
jgi:hypothetical protein